MAPIQSNENCSHGAYVKLVFQLPGVPPNMCSRNRLYIVLTLQIKLFSMSQVKFYKHETSMDNTLMIERVIIDFVQFEVSGFTDFSSIMVFHHSWPLGKIESQNSYSTFYVFDQTDSVVLPEMTTLMPLRQSSNTFNSNSKFLL